MEREGEREVWRERDRVREGGERKMPVFYLIVFINNYSSNQNSKIIKIRE